MKLSSKIVIYSMFGIIQLGIALPSVEAAIHDGNFSVMQEFNQRERDKHERERYERIENERHEDEMRRRGFESEHHWYARQYKELERHKKALRDIKRGNYR